MIAVMRFRNFQVAKSLIIPAFVLAMGYHNAAASPDSWHQEGWKKTDFSKHSVDFSEIISGGPPKDGIPSIDDPQFIQTSNENTLTANEPVISLAIDGDVRAYPIRILIWHEIVNDIVADTPVAVTYCPLCNSAIVFERRLDGQTLDFGTTGKLRNSDLVMYDRQTESWWQQFTGEAIVGSYLGKSLKLIPARLESFGMFKSRYPKGKVLVPNDPGLRAYGRNPYAGYDSAPAPFLYQGDLPEGINPMVRVVVVKADGKPYALTLELLRKRKRIDIGDITLSWQKGQNSALDSSNISDGRDVGNVVVQRRTKDGMADIPYDVTFAFVFHAFHPDLPIRKS